MKKCDCMYRVCPTCVLYGSPYNSDIRPYEILKALYKPNANRPLNPNRKREIFIHKYIHSLKATEKFHCELKPLLKITSTKLLVIVDSLLELLKAQYIISWIYLDSGTISDCIRLLDYC